MSAPRLDFGDEKAVGEWLGRMRVVCADMDALIEDATRRKRERRLGMAELKRLYHEAHDAQASLFAYAGHGGSVGGDDESA